MPGCPAACKKVVTSGIHVVDRACIRFPVVLHDQCSKVEQIDRSVMCGCTNVISSTFHHGVWNWCGRGERFRDCAFFDIDSIELLLASCYNDFICSFAREAHAAEIFHIWQADVPLCEASPGGEMDALMGDRDDATVTEKQLFDWSIVRGIPLISADMATIGSVFLQLSAIEGGDATLESYEKA